MENEKILEKCCYCNKAILDNADRNNPYDLSKDFYKKYTYADVCCNKCFREIVIPKRKDNFGKN